MIAQSYKIAYIEIDTHAEIAGNFRELISDSQNFQVDYYFSDKILKILNIESSDSVFRASSENLFQQLKGKKYDLVIIGTAHRYFNIFLKIAQNFPTAIITHNLNFIKASEWNLLRNVFKKETRFRLKLLLKEGLLKKNKLYDSAKELWVLDKNLANEREYHFLPIFFTKCIAENIQNNVFSIVIPGTVSQKRRDYKQAVQMLKNLEIYQKLEIVFLGKAEGEELEWIKSLIETKQQKIDVVYFTDKIPQNIFDDYLKKADILWCPIQRKAEFFSIQEVYGHTKMSGNIGDAIKYAKKAIFPRNYPSQYFFIDNENREVDFFMKEKKLWSEVNWEIFKKEKVLLDLEKIIFNFVETKK